MTMAGFGYPYFGSAFGYVSPVVSSKPTTYSAPCVAACETISSSACAVAQAPASKSWRQQSRSKLAGANSFFSAGGSSRNASPSSNFLSIHSAIPTSSSQRRVSANKSSPTIPTIATNKEAPVDALSDEAGDEELGRDDDVSMVASEGGGFHFDMGSSLRPPHRRVSPLQKSLHRRNVSWRFGGFAGVSRSHQGSTKNLLPPPPVVQPRSSDVTGGMPAKPSRKILKNVRDLLWSSSGNLFPAFQPKQHKVSAGRLSIDALEGGYVKPRGSPTVLTCSPFLRMEALSVSPTHTVSRTPPHFVTVDTTTTLTTLRRLRNSELAPVLPPEALAGPAVAFQETHGIYVKPYMSGFHANSKSRKALARLDSNFLQDLLSSPSSVAKLSSRTDEPDDEDTADKVLGDYSRSSVSSGAIDEGESGVSERSLKPLISRSSAIPVQVSIAKGFVVVRGNTIERYTRQGTLSRRVATQDHPVVAASIGEILGFGKVILVLSAHSEFFVMRIDKLELLGNFPLDSLDLAWASYTGHHAHRPPPAAEKRIPTCFVCPTRLGYRTGPLLVGSTTGLVQLWRIPEMVCEVLLPPPTPLGAEMPVVGIAWQRFSAPAVPEFEDVASPWRLYGSRRGTNMKLNKIVTFAWIIYGDGRGALWEVDPVYTFTGGVHCQTLRGLEGMPPLQTLPLGDVGAGAQWAGYFPEIDNEVIQTHRGYCIKTIFEWSRITIRRKYLSSPLAEELEFIRILPEFFDLSVALIIAKTKRQGLPGILVLTPRSPENPVVDFVSFSELGLKFGFDPRARADTNDSGSSDAIISSPKGSLLGERRGDQLDSLAQAPQIELENDLLASIEQLDSVKGIGLNSLDPVQCGDPEIHVCAARIDVDVAGGPTNGGWTRKADCLILECRGVIHVVQIEVQDIGDLQKTSCVPLATHLTECQEPLSSLRYEEDYDDLFLGLKSGSFLVISKFSEQISRTRKR